MANRVDLPIGAPSFLARAEHRVGEPPRPGAYDLVVVANRLAVDRLTEPDGTSSWRRSPGGLVTALAPIMSRREGAWVGWGGVAGEELDPFTHEGMHLVPVQLSRDELVEYYEGFSNSTLWPLYHDVIARPAFHRQWWDTYLTVNVRFARAAAATAAPGATVWVQDYQLQLVPRLLRRIRPDVRIGYFHHIPFPPVDIYAQLPWRRSLLEGLLGADLIGFQRRSDVQNFTGAVRRLLGGSFRAGTLAVNDAADAVNGTGGSGGSGGSGSHGADGGGNPGGSGGERPVTVGAFPISIDVDTITRLAQDPDVQARAEQIREELGHPRTVLLGVDRLDYTKGIQHRIKAYAELLDEGRLDVADSCLVQVASPSRENVESYQELRDDIELAVGRVNGTYSTIRQTAIRYLHHSYPVEEMVALYLAADVMLVTALRDGMNLVAKEYVAARGGRGGVLVLSEFAGASDQLRRALLVNPHDIDGMKDSILEAVHMDPAEATRRMRSMHRQIITHDVNRWSQDFLGRLTGHPSDEGGGGGVPGDDAGPEGTR